MGMPAVAEVGAEFADDDGDSDTAEISKLEKHGIDISLYDDFYGSEDNKSLIKVLKKDHNVPHISWADKTVMSFF